MKRNRMMRIASFLLIAVLATTCAISGTFAKYTSDFTGESKARVAKWSFEVNDDDMAADDQSFDFKLFESVSDANVKTGSGENIIAPGTQGSFQITLENLSEVTAKYNIQLSEDWKHDDQAEIPIVYQLAVDGTRDATWMDLDTFNTTHAGLTNIAMTNGNTVIVVYWQWAFNDANDSISETDTALGWAGTQEITTTAKIHVEQVD